ncbi:MAG: phosphatase PAP2 family protein, partial [Sphingobacteriia bacterium]|nr:phosphatase PAP2 family protein [Sphingobacteriia bacterium]
HSSVGYMLGVFFMIWLRRRPLLAWTALAGALVLGTLLGIGRMAAGDHFLSDVIWSAVIVHAIALGLYYFVLRIPQREALAASQPASPPAPLAYPRLTAAGYGGLAALLVAGVLLATPLKTVQFLLVRPHEQDAPPRTLRLVADEANVILFWTSGADRRAQVRLEARGFGLPWSRVESELTQDREHLTYRLTHRGIFTEKDTKLVVGIVAAEWDRIEVRLDSGDIQIQSAAPPLPALDPMTADGRVVWATH